MDDRRKRLIYRSNHRGMKEMDILVGHFAAARADELSDEQLDRLEVLLDEGDQDLMNWILRKEPTPDHLETDVMRLIREYNKLA
ncbi:MAG: succinate dehydrogenase assembly factor 2 [Magnetovibrionaceae bacterium]